MKQTPRRFSTERLTRSRIPRINYDPVVHSRARLLDQIEANLAHRDAPVLIGSLGRAAATGTEEEFAKRGETSECKKGGLARDIDLFVPNGKLLHFPPDPFPVDTGAITLHDQRIVVENGDYWLVDELLQLEMAVDPDVFMPHHTRLFEEVEVRTFSALTQFALLFVIYEAPRKYAIGRRLMRRHLGESPLNGAAELYEPFLEFHKRRRLSLLNHTRTAYRRAIPFAVRFSFQPFVRGVIQTLPGRKAGSSALEKSPEAHQ